LLLLAVAAWLAGCADDQGGGSGGGDAAVPDTVHSHLLADLTPDGPFPRFTPGLLRASGYPDHMHAFAWSGWEPPVDKDGLSYGPGSLCCNMAVVPRDGLTVEPGSIRYRSIELTFDPAVEVCAIMPFVEMCDLGRIRCRDLLGLEAGGTLRIENPDDLAAYQAATGYGPWRHYRLRGDDCLVQDISTLMARTLFGHAAVSLVTSWTLQSSVPGDLPPWLTHGLAAYLADEGVHLANYMVQFRAAGPVLLPPAETNAILAGTPDPDLAADRRLFRQATYSAFLMVWELVENRGGLADVRRLLADVSHGESLAAACRKVYDTGLEDLVAQLDPTGRDEPIGDAVQSRAPHGPPDR